MKNNRLYKFLKWLTVILTVTLVIIGGGWTWFYGQSDDLWRIVSKQCIPQYIAQERTGQSLQPPCIDVVPSPTIEKGYAIFEDRKGPMHILLIPTEKIIGIEDRRLLEPETTDYFSKAWDSRHYLTRLANKTVSREMVSLTINSAWGRSQEQLHIHIACIRPEIKAHLVSQLEDFSDQWTSVEYGVNNDFYLVRTLTEKQFQEMSLFRRLANEIPDAEKEMGKYGMALVPYRDKNKQPMYLMLANKVDVMDLNLGYTGDIQDYQCDLLNTKPLF